MFTDHLLPISAFALYAETHFRFFRFFPSVIFRSEPEIVFDLPRRLAPGKDLPVTLIINDIDRFPCELSHVSVSVSYTGTPPALFTFDDPGAHAVSHPLQRQSAVYLFTIKRTALKTGCAFVNCKAVVRRGGAAIEVLNDNLVTASARPYCCLVTDAFLPGQERCSYGDLHVHSQFSQSHVEFGPPVSVIQTAAGAFGLDFLSITDHSYDLACDIGNYLARDAGRRRWELSCGETGRLRGSRPIVLQGEEVSCRNRSGLVVHLCGAGQRQYVPGSRDGARLWFRQEPDLTVEQAALNIAEQHGLSFAAHPGSRVGLLQRLLLGRGAWRNQDVTGRLDGLQALNSGFTRSWVRAKRLWLAALRRGMRLTLVGGNDPHGDFNRYRSIRKPFLMVTENFDRYLGFGRTGVYGRPENEAGVIEALRLGRTFVTTGPFIGLYRDSGCTEPAVGKPDLPIDTETKLRLVVESSPETGALQVVTVNAWYAGCVEEIRLFSRTFTESCHRFIQEVDPGLIPAGARGYIRAEALCVQGGTAPEACQAATSPCYFVKT